MRARVRAPRTFARANCERAIVLTSAYCNVMNVNGASLRVVVDDVVPHFQGLNSMFSNRRHRGDNLGVFLLASQMLSSGPIPPVTLSAILFQAAVFLGFVPALGRKRTYDLCLLPSSVVGKGEWTRMLASVVMHGDDMHLYFNMVSLMWKGRRLERLLGSVRFAVILVVFAIATSATMIGIAVLVDDVLELRGLNLMRECAVGFSGVLFALKVLHTTYFPHEDAVLLGWLPIPSRYACWAELVLIQLISPNASFVGHLAGILVGLLYTMGPLKALVDAIEAVIPIGNSPSTPRFSSRPASSSSRSRTDWGSGTWGSGRSTSGSFGDPANGYSNRPSGTRNYGWGTDSNRNQQFDEYTGGLDEDEQMRRAMDDSLRQRGAWTSSSRSTAPYPER